MLDEAFEVDTKEYGRIDVVGVDAIVALPPVTPQPKTGHWIDKFAGVYRCSCCREIIEIDIEIDYPNGITFNYCPNCGAKMSEIPTGSELQESEDEG